MAVTRINPLRFFHFTDVHNLGGAPGVETAARRRINGGAGYIALQKNAILFNRGIRFRNCGKQRLCIRVLRAAIQFILIRELYDLPKYITATRSEICLTTLKSWAINK